MKEPDLKIFSDNKTLQAIKQGLHQLFWLGVFMITAGILSLLFPVVSTFAINYFIGGLLMFSGTMQLASSSSVKQTGPFFSALLLAVLTLAAGLFLVFNPLSGVIALTLILAVLFIIEGVFHIILAVEIKPHSAWRWMMFSGVVSSALGLYVASGLSELSTMVLGIILGINFLTTGIAFLYLHQKIKSQL